LHEHSNFSVASSEDLDKDFDKMTIHDEDSSAKAASSNASVDDDHKKKGGIKGAFRGFYQNVLKPAFPEAIQDIKIMHGMTALEARVKKEIVDSNLFPEVNHVAEVRRGLELCPEEQAFLGKRTAHVRDHFAKYLGVDPAEVDPRDVPVVSFGGSGGGFRAMLGCSGYSQRMRDTGLWDCLSYVSGVSGSCWALAAYYTIGKGSHQKVIDHCKTRLAPYHPLSGDAIRAILSSPGGARTTLGPLIQKSKSGLQTVAMDLYAVFTTGWIFFQEDPINAPGGHAEKEVAGAQRSWYKYSSAREYTDNGGDPLPLMTAIRHERPWRDWVDKEHPFKEPDHSSGEHAMAHDAWFQWFEMSPYEVGCDEIQAWCPTWGFGRPFEEGKSTMQLPEQSLALLLGLATSAPAGPLTSYLSTVSRNLPTGFLGNSVHKMAQTVAKLWGKQGTEEFSNHHPLHACNEHNFMFHYTPLDKEKGRPPGLENSPRIHLIDSGMDNNCPTYVLLHPARGADVIINMDASSDVQKDTFQERVDQIGSRRGMKFTKRYDVKAGEDPKDPGRFDGLYAQIYDGVPCERPETVVDSYGRKVTNPPAPVYSRECTMIYMPLLPNERAVPDFDPSTAKFSGSYNLVWTADQVETLIKVCNANFNDGESTIREALHEAWQRKKALREGTYTGPAHPAPGNAPAQRPVDVSAERDTAAGVQQHLQTDVGSAPYNPRSAGNGAPPAAVVGQPAELQGVVGPRSQTSAHPMPPASS
jgi:phospholipase A2